MDEEPICRTCLSTSSKFISLDDKFTYFGQNFSLSAMIASCAPIKIQKDDGLPKRICEYCSTLLQISFMVRIRTLQAETKLRNYLQKKQTGVLQTTSEDSLEPLSLPLFSETNIKNLFKFKQDTETDSLNVESENTKEISTQTVPSVPSVSAQNKYSIHSIKSNTTPDNKLTIEYNPNNTFYLTQKDLDIIQTYLQSIQTDPIQAGTKFIVIKANELNSNSQQVDSNQCAINEHTRDQNLEHENNLSLKISNVQSLSTPNIENKTTYATSNNWNEDSSKSGQEIVAIRTVDCSKNNITPTTSCINTERNSFKDEFQKFISTLEQNPPVKSYSEEFRPIVGFSPRNKRSSILIDDDNIAECINENNSLNVLNDKLENIKNNRRKVRRLTQEDQSIIIID